MNLIARAQGICLKPKDEWVKIKGESTPVMTLFMQYVIPLAAIPAIAQFIGFGLIGVRVPFFGNLRLPLGTAIFRALLTYVLSIVSVYVGGLIINALAPNFGSKPNLENAMKLIVYSMTPAWVAGVFYIIPSLGVLAGLAGLYGLYILYLGFQTPMMETPKDKATTYFVVSLVVMVALWFIVGLVVGAVFSLRAVPTL